MAAATSKDPQWHRVIEIATKLWVDGTYQADIDRSPVQGLVDLQWAAHQAGRVLGGRSKVRTSSGRGPDDPTVTLTVTYVEADGRGLLRAEEGLEKLLRKVLAEHAGT